MHHPHKTHEGNAQGCTVSGVNQGRSLSYCIDCTDDSSILICILILYFILFLLYDVLEVVNRLWGLSSKEVTK